MNPASKRKHEDNQEEKKIDEIVSKVEEKEKNNEPVSKKKKKKKERPPSLEYNLEELFSATGKRPGASSLNINDIRSLLMLKLTLPKYAVLPNWCQLQSWQKIRRSLLILAGGITQQDYQQHKTCFPFLNTFFEKGAIPVRNEGNDTTLKSPVESYLRYRMSKRLQQEKSEQIKQVGRKEAHEYILTQEQMQLHEYPVWNTATQEHGFTTTQRKNKTSPAHKQSKLLAIDCEMCETRDDNRSVTRISAVDNGLVTVYDTLVKPDSPITDYLTQYSGITAEMMNNATTRLPEVIEHLLTIISPDTILIGHSLNFDLNALKLHHDNIIDTSILYTDKRGPRYKSSLKYLVNENLSRTIQSSIEGHCSIEDAKACMELVKLKLEKGSLVGEQDLLTESIFEALTRADKVGAMIDSPVLARQYDHGNNHTISCTTDDDVVSHGMKMCNKVDFTFCHLRTYEDLLKRDFGEVTEDTKTEMFEASDKRISDIAKSLENESLLVVAFTAGYVTPEIMRKLRDREMRKEENVKTAVKLSKQGVCFVKIV